MERIDEILAYAVKPGKFAESHIPAPFLEITNLASRIPLLLLGGCSFLHRDDLSSRSGVRKKESSNLHLDLLDCRLHLRDVCQGLRYRSETDNRRQQPIRPRIHIRFRHCYRFLHSHPDELHQQGIERLLDLDVSGTA